LISIGEDRLRNHEISNLVGKQVVLLGGEGKGQQHRLEGQVGHEERLGLMGEEFLVEPNLNDQRRIVLLVTFLPVKLQHDFSQLGGE